MQGSRREKCHHLQLLGAPNLLRHLLSRPPFAYSSLSSRLLDTLDQDSLTTMVRSLLLSLIYLTLLLVVNQANAGAQDVQTVATPIIAPNESYHVNSVTARITCNTPDAQIYYTLNGDIPQESNGKLVAPNSFIIVDKVGTNTLRAIGFHDGMTASAVATKTFIIQQRCATPVLDPNGGTFAGQVTATLKSDTVGSTMYYAIGTVPS